MTDTENTRLDYYLRHEQWYAQPGFHAHGDAPEIQVLRQAYRANGAEDGCVWEFGIRLHTFSHDGSSLRVEAFADAWAAFTDVPDLFTGLAALGESATLDQVRALLDGLGFTDVTKRTNPYEALAQ